MYSTIQLKAENPVWAITCFQKDKKMSQVKIFVTIPLCLFILSGLKGNRCILWVLQGQHSVTQGFFSPSFHALCFVFYYIKPRSLIFQDLKKALQTQWLLLKHTQPFCFKKSTTPRDSFLHFSVLGDSPHFRTDIKGHQRMCCIKPGVLCPQELHGTAT